MQHIGQHNLITFLLEEYFIPYSGRSVSWYLSDTRSDFPDNVSVSAVNQSSCYMAAATHSLYFGICFYTASWYSALTSCNLSMALPASACARDPWVFHTTTPSPLLNQVVKMFCTGLLEVGPYLPSCPDVLASEVNGVACITLDLPWLLLEAMSVTVLQKMSSSCWHLQTDEIWSFKWIIPHTNWCLIQRVLHYISCELTLSACRASSWICTYFVNIAPLYCTDHLFNNIFSCPGNKCWITGWIVNNTLEWMWKEAVVT
jgi:hypothetical protein